jgi:Family of unknown function (DUF5684)
MSMLAAGTGPMTILVIIAVFYALLVYPVYRVAKATHDCADEAWFAWVPILSTVLMCRVARVSAWSMLVLLLVVVPVLGWLVSFGYSLFLWVRIGDRFGRTGLAVVAGLLPVIGAWLFAFGITPEAA